MRKMSVRIFSALLFIAMLSTQVFAGNGDFSIGESFDRKYPELRGVWVSTVLNLDFPSKAGISSEEMKAEIISILDRTAEIGLNAVILQVRPAGDALYKSEIFPWSQYLCGIQGQAPDSGFDPLAFWVTQAHERGIELHAWINPYRVSHSAHNRTDVNLLSIDNPARLNPTWAKAYKDGGLYYDPGIPEVRRLVVNGITEIIMKYDVDGIHLDDYFYPGTDFPDDNTYQMYGNGMDKGDWRRENVNMLIRDIQKAVRETKPNVRFGVSPFAIWQNLNTSPLGSDTNGTESYTAMYGDTRRWVKEGWLDYICPQIYWYINYPIADYKKVLEWWIDVCAGTGVDLYVGHAAYKEAEGSAEWKGQMLEQLRLNARSEAVAGSIFFRYSHIKGGVGNQINAFYANNIEVEPENPIVFSEGPYEALYPLAVNQPAGNVSTEGNGFYIMGTCDPNYVLYMNGKPVETRTTEGFFGVYATLDVGDNTFTFIQDGAISVSRTITKKAPAITQPPVTTVADPKISEAYPTGAEYRSEGDVITLKCRAPKNAQVSVIVNGAEYSMNESTSGYSDGTASYTFGYTFPVFSEGGRIADLGSPQYKMTYSDKYYQTYATGKLNCITRRTPYYATVTAESAWAYEGATTDSGTSWILTKGQKDAISAITGDGSWVRLATGQWIQKSNVSCVYEDILIDNQIYDSRYYNTNDSDIIKWRSDIAPAIKTDYDGSALTVKFALTSGLPWLMFPGDSIFESITAINENGISGYVFKLKEGERIEGYYSEINDEGISLHIKKLRRVTEGGLPLSGFKFVIDAGHGYDDVGALGPLGAAISEKDLNLKNARKLSERLEALGATVIRVRNSDVFYTLYERTEISRAEKPDLFISIHANAVDKTTDSTKINGLTMWYRNENSKAFASFMIDCLYDVNPYSNRRRQAEQANFYVCRPTWAPSVIVETSFMCNPYDFSWLVNEQSQNKLADAIVDCILKYYGGQG